MRCVTTYLSSFEECLVLRDSVVTATLTDKHARLVRTPGKKSVAMLDADGLCLACGEK